MLSQSSQISTSQPVSALVFLALSKFEDMDFYKNCKSTKELKTPENKKIIFLSFQATYEHSSS
jgi:hypothetical protein